MPHVERTSANAFEVKHAKDHERSVARKADRDGNVRMERHSGNGASIKASPKKGGRGHGGWGSWKDDVDM